MRQLVWTLVVLVLCGCAESDKSAGTEPNLKTDFQTRYVDPYVAGDTDGWMEVFADDAVALHDGLPPLEGKVAIRSFAEAVAANFSINRLDAEIDEVRRNGDWAWTRGQFVADFEAKSDAAPPGVAGERWGKFMIVWERQADGRWLVIMDMGNGMQAPGET